MTEADEKRVARLRAWRDEGARISSSLGYRAGDHTFATDVIALLRLLDERAAEVERLERSVTRAEAELQRLSFAAGNVALDHPDWPPEYARHLAALVARAEAAERRVAELEEALRPDLLEGAADEIEHLLDGGEPTQTEAQVEALRNYAAIQHAALSTTKEAP